MTTLIDRAVICHADGLEVTLPDGTSQYFNYFWLRDTCPSGIDAETRERSFDLFTLPAPPRPAAATVDDGALVITWADSGPDQGHVTRHDLDVLAARAKPGKRPDAADLPRRAWYGDHYARMVRVPQAALATDPASLATLTHALLVDGVALITGMPDGPTALEETAANIGHVRASFFGPSFEVKLHIKPTNLAYTSKALEMHTDLPPEDLAPGIQFLHCIANTVEGGHSLFLDGMAVAEEFRQTNPEDFTLLSEIEIPFCCEHDAFDMRARQRVIELDDAGQVSGVTISGHLQDVFDLPQDVLDRYYPAFWRFGRRLHDPKYVMRFRLNAGECIVFDNHRIVHGREAYSATSGARHLRGLYTDRGELRSTHRRLAARGHA